MDLFPKDYKKSDSLSPAADSGSAAISKLKNLASEPRARGVFLRVGAILSVAAFLLVGLLWGGMFFYKKSLASQISDSKKQQSEVFSAQDKELIAKIVDFDEGAALTQSLLKNHIYSLNFFDKLASFTVPRVQWQTFDFFTKDNSVALKGFASDYSNLAKQILALEEGGFLNVKVGDILLDETGRVAFSAAFNFDPKILQK